MNRRLLLKQLAISATAAVLLPSCLVDKEKVSMALNNLKVSESELDLLSLLAETIIPETDTPGAKSVNAHQFALVMIDDCLSRDEQARYLAGMRSFDQAVIGMIGKSFADASTEERVKALQQIESNKDSNTEELNTFYRRTKGYIVQGYVASQHFMTNVKKYQHVPGPKFLGCVPVSNNEKTNV